MPPTSRAAGGALPSADEDTASSSAGAPAAPGTAGSGTRPSEGSRSGGPLRVVAPVVVAVALVVVGAVAYHLGQTSEPGSASPPATAAPPDHLAAQPVDVGFAEDMLDHHAQAVQMALVALNKATTPEVRTLATEILTSQQRESGQLTQFLADRGITTYDQQRTVMAWMGEPTTHDRMPGLATPDQMVALTGAQGTDVDRQFVTLMIAHHQGGVHMAQFAAQHAETQALRDLAARMVVDQQQQITELQELQGG
jgi:uncharacterized protein (DUF305 family)